MTPKSLLVQRNRVFAEDFDAGDMPALPKLRMVILACIDARVDPAHVVGLELGEAVVFRNNGGRVTAAFIEEIAALCLLVERLTGAESAHFHIMLMQHTKCGAMAFADSRFQELARARMSIDVSPSAITDNHDNLATDMERLRDAKILPDTLTVSAALYSVETGLIEETAAERSLAELRREAARAAR